MKTHIIITHLIFLLVACSSQKVAEQLDNKEAFANVVEVEVSGNENSYNFSVTLASPDKGCNQYANWWEVISENGELVYRRILGHSHVIEQPFTRSGGSVNITANQIVWIRAHMNNEGYGGKTFKGSVLNGFVEVDMPSEFALNIEKDSPQPSTCAF